MDPQHDLLLRTSIIILAALVAVTLAIAILRKLQSVLVVAALVVGIGWGVYLYPKYRDRLSLPNIDIPVLRIPAPNPIAPQTPANEDLRQGIPDDRVS